jgi:hypothetical protein
MKLKVGDLLKTRPNMGFSWWREVLFLLVRIREPSDSWGEIMYPDGRLIKVDLGVFENANENND